MSTALRLAARFRRRDSLSGRARPPGRQPPPPPPHRRPSATQLCHYPHAVSVVRPPAITNRTIDHRPSRTGGRLHSKTGMFSPKEIALAKTLNSSRRRVILWSREKLEPFYIYEADDRHIRRRVPPLHGADLAHLAGHLLAAAPLLHAGILARAALWAPVSCSILCAWATAWRAVSLCVNRSSFSVSSSDTGVSA